MLKVTDIIDDLKISQFLAIFKENYENDDINNNGVDMTVMQGNGGYGRIRDDDNQSKSAEEKREIYAEQGIKWILNVLARNRDGFESVDPNYVPVLLDLTLYKHSQLVSDAFDLVVRYFSQRKNLVELL